MRETSSPFLEVGGKNVTTEKAYTNSCRPHPVAQWLTPLYTDPKHWHKAFQRWPNTAYEEGSILSPPWVRLPKTPLTPPPKNWGTWPKYFAQITLWTFCQNHQRYWWSFSVTRAAGLNIHPMPDNCVSCAFSLPKTTFAQGLDGCFRFFLD